MRDAARRALLAAAVLAAGLALAEGALRLAGAWLAWSGRERAAGTGRLRVLCLGESTTAPTGLRDHSWPAQLEGLLNADGPAATVVNAGVSGTLSSVLALRLPGLLERHRPHVVITMMGINDSRWTPRRAAAPSGRLRGGLRLSRAAAYARRAWRRRRWLAERRAGLDALDDAARWERLVVPCLLHRPGAPGPLDETCPAVAAWAAARRPDDWRAVMAAGWTAWREGRRAEAERAFARALAVSDAAGDEGRLQLAAFLRGAGETARARRLEDAEQRASAGGLERMTRLAWHLLRTGENRRGESLARAILRARPGHGPAAAALFRLRVQRGAAPAERAALGAAAVAAAPEDVDTRLMHARLSLRDGREEEAADLLEALLRRDPGALEQEAELAEACARLRPGRVPPPSRKAFTGDVRLAELAAAQLLLLGRAEEAPRLYDDFVAEEEEAPELSPAAPWSSPREATAAAAEDVERALRGRGARWIAMQYPLLPLAGLRERLGTAAPDRLVENRENFSAALRAGRWEDVFRDRFAGRFGHCTPAGDRLLAESAAAAVRGLLDARAPAPEAR